MEWKRIEDALAPYGLITRGGFQVTAADNLGDGIRSLVLVGNAGPAMWRVFEQQRTPHANAMDIWTRDVLERVAVELDAAVRFPFGGPPWHPFQRWAQRAEPVFSSPIMLLIHPEYGLWHGYRAALLFDEEIALPAPARAVSPCDSCGERPCLSACPVAAFDGTGYDVPACAAFLETAEGTDCMSNACAARRACPVGADYRYDQAQAAFHMTAFQRARRD